MATNPYMRFYVGDWIRDTRKLTLEEKGTWADLLMFMHTDNECGFVEGTWEEICRLCGGKDENSFKQIVCKILAKGVCDIEAKSVSNSLPNVEAKEVANNFQNSEQNSSKTEIVRIINRRMFKAFLISQKRSKIGSKGGSKKAENLKAKQEASFVPNDLSNDLANDLPNSLQNCGYGYGYGIKEEKEVIGEKEENVSEPQKVFVVPEMLNVWKHHKPKYIAQTDKDYPALFKIAKLIGEQEFVEVESISGIERIKIVWNEICAFVVADKFYKDFTLFQIEKYVQAIVSKMQSRESEPVPQSNSSKKSVVHNNYEAANSAIEMLRQQHANA